MFTVGLTGGVAAGKSAVADVWGEEGVPVVRADDLARQVVEPGTPGLREVADAFGPGVIREDGSLNRDALRDRIFRDDAERVKLEAILHPRIARQRRAWTEARRQEGCTLTVAEIPLLFETGFEAEFDRVVVVHAPRQERLRRLVDERGIDRDEAQRILESQMDADEKRRRADVVILNDGDLRDLRVRAVDALKRLRKEAEEAGAGGVWPGPGEAGAGPS